MKKLLKIIIGLVVLPIMLINLVSCAVLMFKPGLVDCEDFVKNAGEMNVSGRYGWNFNKVVRFGPFYTSKFNNSLVKEKIDEPTGLSYNSDKTEYVNAQKCISFKQFDSTGNSIKVKCFAERNTEITQYSKEWSGDEMISDKYEVRFFQNNREFVLLYTPGNNKVSSIKFEDDTFNIVNDFKSDFNANKVFRGFFIKSKNEILAAIEMTNNGMVWIKNDLDAKIKLRLAAISTAILLKPDL